MTPLNAALTQLGRSMPLTAANIWAVIRQGFAWQNVALRGGWAPEMYQLFLGQGLRELFYQYKMAPYGGEHD